MMSSHCNKETKLAAMVSPPIAYSIKSTGSNTTISSMFSGTLAMLLATCKDILTCEVVLDEVFSEQVS